MGKQTSGAARMFASSGQQGNKYNELWSSPEKVALSDSETITAELALAVRVHGRKVSGRKRDLLKSYWQVPRSQRGPIIDVIFWDPVQKCVRCRLQLSQDFGSAGAVWVCNHVFRAILHVLQYWFLCPVDHY